MKRRRLAVELQRLRAQSRYTLEAVAEHLECSPAKISRIENGQVAVRIQDARELLELYKVQGERRDSLLEMVREARRKGWWSGYSDVLREDTETLLSLEDEATAILIYETTLVTGLLQTESYALELMSQWGDVPLPDISQRLKLRMERQKILERPQAPALTVILDESCLRRPVGRDKGVMREQFTRLLEASAGSRVTLRILRFESGAHQAMGFPFHIFTFDEGDPIVYVELLDHGQFLEDVGEVARYRSAFDQVAAKALDPEKSRSFLNALLDELDRPGRAKDFEQD